MFDWNEKEILRYLGCREIKPPKDIGNLVRECERELEQAAVLRAYWREYPLHAEEDDLDLGAFRTRSRSLARNLRGCEAVILFAATLGTGVDMLLKRYGRLQMSKCVVLQAAAASMLETCCDKRNEELRLEYLEKGLYLRPRFSPGYGDFSLECQRPFAAALELGKRIGITLTDSLLMMPSKSVTAVIGVSEKPLACGPQGCGACQKMDCAYRELGL